MGEQRDMPEQPPGDRAGAPPDPSASPRPPDPTLVAGIGNDETDRHPRTEPEAATSARSDVAGPAAGTASEPVVPADEATRPIARDRPIPPDQPGGPDQPTEPAVTRWTGAAPVPPPAPRPDRRLSIRKNRPAKHPDPTLELPPEEPVPAPPAGAGWSGPPGHGPQWHPPPGATAHEPAPYPPPPVDPWADVAPPWDEPHGWPATPHPIPHQPALPAATPPSPPPAGPAATGRLPVPPQPAQLPAVREKRSPRWRGLRRRTTPAPAPVRPAAPPADWVVPRGYELRRRRRRWPLRLTLLLLTFGCCCACPAYYVTPVWRQYPASATITGEVAGLTLRDDPEVTRKLEARARGENWFAEDTFAAVYDGGPGWQVTVYGNTGFRLTPESDLDAEVARLTKEFNLPEVREVESGDLGGHQRCGVGTADGDDLVVCAWADHGSLGVATFSAGSIERSAETLRELRAAIITRE